MIFGSSLTAAAVLFASIAAAADCNDQQRPEGSPSGDQVAKAITGYDALKNICTGGFPPGRELDNIWNHGQMYFQITRPDASKDLQHCTDALQNIIDQCITGGGAYGGQWSLDGETYKIYNNDFPKNPLMPQDEGGLSGSQDNPGASSTTSTTAARPLKSGETIVVTVVDGSTITATFEPTTYSQYSTLTTTTTITSTDDNGNLIPIVIGAGGIAWIILGGAAAAPVPIIPPPTPPPTPGNPNNPDNPDDSITTTTTSSSTSSSSSSSSAPECPLATIEPDFPFALDENGMLPQITLAIDDVEEATPTDSPGTIPTQDTSPIDKPTCDKNTVSSVPKKLQTNAGAVDLDTILYSLRQQLCGGGCSAPGDVPADTAVVKASDDYGSCEINIGISEEAEAFFYRTSKPEGDQWQQCWDSTDEIIKDCVGGKGGQGWWNGNHVYQFYKGGVRRRNDEGSEHKTGVDKWLQEPGKEENTPGVEPEWCKNSKDFTCGSQCRSQIWCTTWCVANCGHCLTAHSVC